MQPKPNMSLVPDALATWSFSVIFTPYCFVRKQKAGCIYPLVPRFVSTKRGTYSPRKARTRLVEPLFHSNTWLPAAQKLLQGQAPNATLLYTSPVEGGNMGRILKWLLAITAVIAARSAWKHLKASPSIGTKRPASAKVYVSQNGAKYHRQNCRFASDGMIPISLDQAARTYEPCSVCKPRSL